MGSLPLKRGRNSRNVSVSMNWGEGVRNIVESPNPAGNCQLCYVHFTIPLIGPGGGGGGQGGDGGQADDLHKAYRFREKRGGGLGGGVGGSCETLPTIYGAGPECSSGPRWPENSDFLRCSLAGFHQWRF